MPFRMGAQKKKSNPSQFAEFEDADPNRPGSPDQDPKTLKAADAREKGDDDELIPEDAYDEWYGREPGKRPEEPDQSNQPTKA